MACAHEGHGEGLSGARLDAALAAAEALAEERHERMTPPRRRVLELLLQADGPVKAYDLMAAFGGGEGGPAKPPTVYRALDFLERQGLAHRIESLNAFIACRREGEAHGAAFLICDCCGLAQEVSPPDSAGRAALAGDSGFAVRHVVLEARGVCAACQAGAEA